VAHDHELPAAIEVGHVVLESSTDVAQRPEAAVGPLNRPTAPESLIAASVEPPPSPPSAPPPVSDRRRVEGDLPVERSIDLATG